ncbi:MAG: O-antigen ligase family protein [Muribaculaceae bacterium]|nr:O-antigen ligase family protein [Muribaculaceae bacterium]
MEILNIFYFLVLTIICYNKLISRGSVLKSPFNANDRLAVTGPEMYWIIVFSTGLFAFSFDLGLDMSAIRLFVLMCLCGLGLLYTAGRPILSWPLKIYCVYLLWLIVGMVYAPSFGYGLRVFLKYLYPLLFCMFASAVITDFAGAFKAAVTARLVALIVLIISFIPLSHVIFPGTIWYTTAEVIHFIPMMMFSIALVFFTREKWQNALYTLSFFLPCFILTLRTSILGSIAALMSGSFIRWRVKALPVIAGLLIASVAALFALPSLRNKMFYGKNLSISMLTQGKISQDHINTNYRAYLWKTLQDALYKDHELTGSGTGAVQNMMYNNPKKFVGLKVAHSDFVQMMCDNGLIGLVLYGGMTLSIFIHCFRIYWGTHDNRIRIFAFTAGASILGVVATCYSDNTVNYSMATLALPFGFYGMTLALKERLKD